MAIFWEEQEPVPSPVADADASRPTQGQAASGTRPLACFIFVLT
jgi:hypothetical protein